MPNNPIVNNGPLRIEDRAANFHPNQWDSQIYHYKPFVQKATLTAMLSRLGSERAESRQYHWAYQAFNGLLGKASRAKTDVSLSTNYTYNAGSGVGIVGSVLYLQMTAAHAKIIRPRNILQIGTKESDLLTADVLSVNVATDDTSYAVIELLEADTGNVLANTTLYWTIIQEGYPEITELPPGQTEEAAWLYNYAGVQMESTELSWAEIKELERVNPNVRERQSTAALDRLMLKRERALLMGHKRAKGNTFYTGGIEWWLKSSEGGNGDHVYDFTSDTDFSGMKFEEDGLDRLLDISVDLGQFSDSAEKWCLAGDLALRSIQKAVFNNTTYQIESMETDFGIRVMKLYGTNQTWNMVEAPAFKIDPMRRRNMLVCEPEQMGIRTYFPLTFVPGAKLEELSKINGHTFVTSDKFGWWVQEGLKINNFSAHAWIYNVGKDSQL